VILSSTIREGKEICITKSVFLCGEEKRKRFLYFQMWRRQRGEVPIYQNNPNYLVERRVVPTNINYHVGAFIFDA